LSVSLAEVVNKIEKNRIFVKNLCRTVSIWRGGTLYKELTDQRGDHDASSDRRGSGLFGGAGVFGGG
jgi:hypothetical protein